MVTAALIGAASAAAASSPAPGNRGWITGGAGSDSPVPPRTAVR